MDVSNEITEDAAIYDTDKKHQKYRCRNRHHPDSHKVSAQCTEEANQGTAGQIDVSACQHAHQHTAGKDEYISVLRNQLVKVKRREHCSARPDRKEEIDKNEDDEHGIIF